MSNNGRNTNRMRIIQTATAAPAAGANATLALTGHPSKILVAASWRLVTDATAGNRIVHLDWHHAATQIKIAIACAVTVASTTVDYYAHPAATLTTLTNLLALTMTIPPELDLASADYYDLVVDNIKATDQLSAIYHFWKVQY